jgi:hypothetical protein
MIVPLLVIIILVLAGGLGYVLYTRVPVSEVTEASAPAIATPSSAEEATEVVLQDTCDSISDQARKDNCYMNLAQKSFDEAWCENIGVETGEGSIDACYQKLAIDTYTLAYCNMIGEVSAPVSVDACYVEIAVALQETELCFYAEEISLTDWSQDACFSRIAKATDDDVLCGYIYTQNISEGAYSKEDCLTQFGMTLEDYNVKYLGG